MTSGLQTKNNDSSSGAVVLQKGLCMVSNEYIF